MEIPIFSEVCQKDVFEQQFTVGLEDIDQNGTLRWSVLPRKMQKITEDHMESLGLDWSKLRESGKTWVIEWTSMQIQRLPKLGENVILRVWASGRKMMMHTRKYAFYTASGEPLAGVSSIFMLMDMKTRTAIQEADEIPSVPMVVMENETPLPKMRGGIPKVLSQSKKRIVGPEEIDFNGHMNNSCYLDWVQDLCMNEVESPKTIWLQYNSELLEGQQVEIVYEKTADQLVGKMCMTDQDAFQFKMGFGQ